MTTCLRWPILIQPKQIPMQLLLYKTTTCLAWPATTFICLTNKKNFFKTTTIEIQPAKKWWTNIRRKCIKNKRLYPANTKRLYQRRSSVEFRRRNDVVTQSQWKCWYDVETRRYSIVSSWRRDNVVSTSEQPQTTSIKGSLNVVMRRGNDVVFWRCIHISTATTLRRKVNVGIRRHLWLLKRRDLTLSRRHLRLARPLFNIFKPIKVHMFCIRKRVKNTYG